MNKIVYEYEGVQELTSKIKENDYLGNITIKYENEILNVFQIHLDQEVKYYYPALYISIIIILIIAILVVLRLKKMRRF